MTVYKLCAAALFGGMAGLAVCGLIAEIIERIIKARCGGGK